MNATGFMITHAKWEVMWMTKGPRIVCIDCDDDYAEARRLYKKVLKAGKPMATLRCKNVGFPPPDDLRDKMKSYNMRGWYWCPYCVELREFEKRDGYENEGDWVEHKHFACPMCDIMHTNNHVTRYNPHFLVLGFRKKTRGGKKRGKRRRR